MQIGLGGQKPKAIFFSHKRPGALPSLVVVRKNGKMVEVETEFEEFYEYVVCKNPLVLAVPFLECMHSTLPSGPEVNMSTDLPNQGAPRMLLLTGSRKSCIHLVRQDTSPLLFHIFVCENQYR